VINSEDLNDTTVYYVIDDVSHKPTSLYPGSSVYGLNLFQIIAFTSSPPRLTTLLYCIYSDSRGRGGGYLAAKSRESESSVHRNVSRTWANCKTYVCLIKGKWNLQVSHTCFNAPHIIHTVRVLLYLYDSRSRSALTGLEL
jgi:hypothetical protein